MLRNAAVGREVRSETWFATVISSVVLLQFFLVFLGRTFSKKHIPSYSTKLTFAQKQTDKKYILTWSVVDYLRLQMKVAGDSH